MLVLILSSSALSIGLSIGTGPNSGTSTGARASFVNPDDPILAASPSHVYIGQNVSLFANATSDTVGATLRFTIFWDYYLPGFVLNAESPVTVVDTTSPGRVVAQHNYSQPGNWTDPDPRYIVNVFVEDMIDNSNQSNITSIYVSIPPPNTAPRFLSYPNCPVGARANETQHLSAFVADNDSDTVTMFWDFGDGATATNVTVATPSGVYINQTHTWNPRIPGEGDYNATYNFNVSITDGLHPPVNYSSIATIYVFLNFPPNPQASTPKGTVSDHELVSLTVNATDREGDPLTWTFNYTDGTPLEVFHTGYTAPDQLVWMNRTHSFATPGVYPVDIMVSDALVPNQIGSHNASTIVLITVVANSPPTLFPINMVPGSPEINETIGHISVNFSIQAFDPDGDVMTVTWDFSGVSTASNVSTGGSELFTFFQEVTYSEVGNYSVTVTVTDGRLGHIVERTMVANISSDNQAPVILSFDKANTTERNFVLPNETITITIIATDREHDALFAVVSFGDGSANESWANLTNYTNGNITLVLTHSYLKKGDYVITLILTDNKIGGHFNHTGKYIIPIRVDVPAPVIHHYWDWWDYTSLALFMMVPVLLIAWTFQTRRHRRQIEDQGMTYDEWKIRKEVDFKELGK